MKRVMLNLLCVLVVGSAFSLQFSAAFAQEVSCKLLTVFTNPTPAANDCFGNSVAAVGDDHVLIGAYQNNTTVGNDGAAYLFSASGTLLTAFTNSTPTANAYFGYSVAALGADRVLIGAYGYTFAGPDVGAAYLFSTNGTLLTTFTNPAPIGSLSQGASVRAVGGDRVLIGESHDDYLGENWTGAAFLFSTNGVFLMSFTNPAPTANDYFGRSVAVVGSDRILVAASGEDAGASLSGAAYLFSTNGALLTTFTNPTPGDSDWFGISLATVGNDRVLIGACGDDTGGKDAGIAYLFSTNGVLLTTFTNPTPATSSYLGRSVAVAGDNRVLIGAPGNGGASDVGAVHLFKIDGELLTTFTKPTPGVGDQFGRSVAVVGIDRVLIRAHQDDTGATNAGAAYLFNLELSAPGIPSLTIYPTTTNTVAVSWPSPSTGWVLQVNAKDVASVNWSNAPGPIQDDGGTKILIVPPSAENRFYRLIKP